MISHMSTTTKYLRGAIISGCVLSLLTPFIVSTSLFFPFITGKAFFFRILVEIIFALWLILLVRDRSVRPVRSPILYALGIFGVIITLATVFSQYPYHSFWSNFERMEGLITYLHLAAYWLVLVSVFKTKKLWRWFLNTSVAVSLLITFYGFFQLFGWAAIHQGSTRLDATLGNSIYLAVYLLINIFIILYLWADQATVRWQRVTYGIITVLELIVLYYTGTRGAILGLVGGLFLTGILILWRGREVISKKTKQILIGLFVRQLS